MNNVSVRYITLLVCANVVGLCYAGEIDITSTVTLASLDVNASDIYSIYGSGSLDILGTLTNPGAVYTAAGTPTFVFLSVGGALNNQGYTELRGGTANVNALNNTGSFSIDAGASLNITGGGPGVTNIVAGSAYFLGGAFNVINGGATSDALANLSSVEGALTLTNGQTTRLTSLRLASTSMTVLGTGSGLAVTGDLTNSGAIYSAGTLSAGGTLNNQGYTELRGGTANVNALNNAGTLVIEAGASLLIGTGTSAGTGYDQAVDGTMSENIMSAGSYGSILSGGPASLNGTLDILLSQSFIPAIGESFTILRFTPGTLSGAFAMVENDLFNNNTEQWLVSYDNADGDVSLTAEYASATPEPSTMALLGSCLLAMGGYVRLLSRNRRVQKASFHGAGKE